jgi:uncharacterized membrane protein YfcA
MLELSLFLTGLIAGVLGALLGLGGGIFLVPALTILYRLPIRVAVGTGLVSVIATSAGVAAAAKHGRGADVSLALRLEAFTAAGAILGGWVAAFVSSSLLSVFFALMTFFTAGYLIRTSNRTAAGGEEEAIYAPNYRIRHWPIGLVISGGAGIVSGLLGVGGGFIKVPMMYALMGVPLGVATATSNFMVGITAAASVFVYYGRGDLHPLIVAPTVLGVFLGAMMGVDLMMRLRVSWVRLALIVLLLVIGVQMFLRGLLHV